MIQEVGLTILDARTKEKISIFFLARLLLMFGVLLSTIFLKQDVLGENNITALLITLSATFVISAINSIYWEETLKIRNFVASQLLYDLLLTSYLVYLTGVNDSIFLFLYLLNIVSASVVFQLHGALLVAVASGITFAFIYAANTDMEQIKAWYDLAWNELLFLLTALLSGQFMDELKKQQVLLDSQRRSIENLENLNSQLLDNLPLGIALVDKADYIKKINKTALSLLGINHEPSFRIKFYELLPELKDVVPNWKKLSETSRLRFLFKGNNKNRASLSLQVVDFSEIEQNETHRIIVFQDNTKIIELEEKLEYETKLAATGELAAGIAHEIRNPLASISGSIEMLSETLKITSPDDKRLFEIASKEINRLNMLVSDFLEFAKPKDSVAKDTNLSSILHEVKTTLRNQLEKENSSLVIDLSSSLEVHMNEERLKQIFLNLILNSIEAKSKEPLTIKILEHSRNEAKVTIAIQDNGLGIPLSIREKIFDPFFTTKSEGTGLGLPTVAQILHAAKGSISLDPEMNEGCCFLIDLPLGRSIVHNAIEGSPNAK